MSEFGENWCEELCKSLETNSTVLDHWLVDVKCQEELYNLQSQTLSQQNLFDYPQIQHNANVTNVESVLIPLPNNPPNMQSQNDDPPVQRRQRKPRRQWTVEEHVLFLTGLQRYGMSWKKISKDIVRTKTPSQLASHAQKYFERQKIPPSERKRKSIHDITLSLNINPPPVTFNFQAPPGQVLVTPNVHAAPIQDFFMQNIEVPNIHPLVYAPAQNSYMQNIRTTNVDPLVYTPVQDIYKQDIQGQQQMPPFNSPYYK